MTKWLFESQDYIAFLLGALAGFGINLITSEISEKYPTLALTFGVITVAIGILGFWWYKKWIGNLDEFDFFIRHSTWEKKLFNYTETWICKDTDEYQLVRGDKNNTFEEKWAKNICRYEGGNTSCTLFLKRNGIIVREFFWLHLDDERIFIPIPDIITAAKNTETAKSIYYFEKDSLKYRMFEKIGFSANGKFPFHQIIKCGEIEIR